jgi:hypothetical protein
LAQSDGHDAPGLIDQVVPSLAAMIDEIVVGFEDAVGKPVVAHELPDILDRIELGAFWRQRNDGDVGRAWMKQTLPDQALKPHWDEQLAVMNPTSRDSGTSRLTAFATVRLTDEVELGR